MENSHITQDDLKLIEKVLIDRSQEIDVEEIEEILTELLIADITDNRCFSQPHNLDISRMHFNAHSVPLFLRKLYLTITPIDVSSNTHLNDIKTKITELDFASVDNAILRGVDNWIYKDDLYTNACFDYISNISQVYKLIIDILVLCENYTKTIVDEKKGAPGPE